MRYLRIISVFLLTSIFVFYSCKKSVDENSSPKECKIITPHDKEEIQIGTLIPVEAKVLGFAEQVKVVFAIDSAFQIQVSEISPKITWDTQGWELGPHTVKAEAIEGESVATDMISIILVDTIVELMAPVPIISFTPNAGTTDTIFTLDASASYDQEDQSNELLFRWDFEGDGDWDTEFSMQEVYEHKYYRTGHFHITLEVMDTDGMTADTVVSLVVTHSTTPDPCEGFVTIPYGGKIYHLVPVGNQCWLKENIDIGMMIPEGEEQSDNEIIEKYCYDNDSLNCEKYGGLYMWQEMMNYFPGPWGKGICPTGFHIPNDEEWKELEGFTDSHYGSDDPEWDNTFFRGFDAGKRLKARLGWIQGGIGNNLYGFKALASGYWESGLSFAKEGEEAHFWSRSHDSGHNAIKRNLKHDKDGISRSYQWDEAALSVRCIRD